MKKIAIAFAAAALAYATAFAAPTSCPSFPNPKSLTQLGSVRNGNFLILIYDYKHKPWRSVFVMSENGTDQTQFNLIQGPSRDEDGNYYCAYRTQDNKAFGLVTDIDPRANALKALQIL